MKSLHQRVRSLEDRAPRPPDDSTYVVDIGGARDTPPRYWIDGREVGWHEFERRAPRTGFVVDIGGDHAQP